jgi:DNA polymerase elongation subunit (family B)
MYRNIYYDYKKSIIHLWTWSEDGERVKIEVDFEPFLYVEDKNIQDATSIFGTNLKKMSFINNFRRRDFVKNTQNKRIFFNLNPDQQFLLTTFKDASLLENFSKNPLRIYFLDIETYKQNELDAFSTAEEAKDMINVITVYDSLFKKYYVWGLKPYSTLQEDVTYVKCASEKELLSLFLKFWKKNTPDIVSGWNFHGYDLPYIMNRLTILFDEDKNKKMSPIERVEYREGVSVNKLGQKKNQWFLHGVSCLDYMDIYKTFSMGERESYSLGYIGEYELEESKLNYNASSLTKLADTDWTTFVDYNIQDVRLLVKLDDKLKYMDLIRNLSYKGFIPFEKSLGKVSMITGAVAHQALLQNLIIPTFTYENIKQKFEGGYVLQPKPNLYEDVVTYDANSLYPNTIITLNISPETKVGKLLDVKDGKFIIKTIQNKEISLTKEQFLNLIREEKLSITKANVLYTQKFKGVVPNLIDKIYTQRVEAKNKMLDAKKKAAKCKNEDEKRRLLTIANDNDSLSNVYKTLINSIYGVFSQQYSPFFDIDHAKSVTLTGQSVVKKGSQLFHQYLVNKCDYKGSYEDVVKYIDTDSAFLSFKDFFNFKGIKLKDENGLTEDANTFISDLGKYVNEEINEWAKKDLNSLDPRYHFKREKICDVALLQAKKFYILHVLDNEGVKTDKFLYKGIEIVKAALSKEVKELTKNVIESAILAKDRKKASDLFHKGYENFCKLPIEAISVRKNAKSYSKWYDLFNDNKFGKGTPNHYQGALFYNKLLEDYQLKHLYPEIGNGTKIKYFYAQKNKFNIKTMAFIDEYPKEFENSLKIDYKLMFEKNVLPVISRIFYIIGWPLPAIGCEQVTDIISLFSGDKNNL